MRRAEPSAVDDGARSERIAFERLVADLAARFANVAHDRIEAEIADALGRLVEALDYDRCTYSEIGADGTLGVLCSAAVHGIEPLPRGPLSAGSAWLVEEIRAGRIVALANLFTDLPPEARAYADRARQIGLRSHLSIPLRVGGRVAGALSFAGMRSARTWPEETITRLRIIGEVFASALVRARSEDEVRLLRGRLWHADRVARIATLTAAIAHELNQPLTAILSNAQAGLAYLDQGARLEEIRAILEAVVRDNKRAAETIRAMRALLRQDETGRARIDVGAALREVLQLIAAELRRQGVRVETALATGCWAMADKAQIEQVVLNLVLNAATAMQACPRDERVLRVSVLDDGGGRIVAAVRDAGPGIPAAHREAVFEPFWTTRDDGLGLGLAVSRSIVQAHGGRIAVEPNSDRGVTFRFELASAPGGRQPADDASRVPDAAAPREFASREPVVCVVDDDAAVRESLARLLATAGWKVASFASAAEFLERAALTEVGCVLLDNRMPGISGLELQAQLAAEGFAPPVLFLTGHGDVATGVDAMKLGALDFLVKPVERDVLVDAVRKALERQAGARKQALERDACRALVGRLSAREREVTAHVIRGRLNKQIAADLGIAEQTVKQHRGRVMEKLAVRSVPELVRVCEAAGLFAAGVAPK